MSTELDSSVRQVNAADVAELATLGLPPVEAMPEHILSPGIYCRELTMPKGAIVVSKTHKTEHPYFVLKGECDVWTEELGCVRIKAPYRGITKPGTRRVLRIIEETTWITVHANPDDQSVEEIEERIIEPNDNPLIDGVVEKNPDGSFRLKEGLFMEDNK